MQTDRVDLAQDVPKSIATGLLLEIVGALTFNREAIIVKLAYPHCVDGGTPITRCIQFALPIFGAMA